MKTFICLLLSLVGLTAVAQETNQVVSSDTNRLVFVYPDNQPYPGLTNYPQRIEDTDLLTLPPGCFTNFIGGVGWAEYMSAFNAVQFIASANSNRLWKTKYDARAWASNVVNGVDGLSLYLRATAEANWFYLNQIRTNLGYPALTRNAYKTMIDTNIANFGK